ncbi:MAG TPA: lipoate--protein ligase family protein [Candidatus Paceibacterota bacterium]|nr:lipoate--protein ligase family protein [Verrucomicrobiota bacterium]HSA12018.1 lipoate--protein ligase family protein [Candidatus Paceibacterota bacterium]
MKLCDLTLATPEENLACDEVLLNLCEAGESDELLRLWALPEYFVVLGYANKAATEVNLPYCHKHTIPVLRRCSGGGAVLQGPGVLNYSLVLRMDHCGPFHSIHATNRLILERHRDTLAPLLMAPVEWRGQTDLAIGGLKFSGNSQRRHRRFLLFHGSFLLHLDLSLVEKTLPQPSRQPDYRLNRSHSDFLINLNVPPHALKTALAKAWKATIPLAPIPLDLITRLVGEKYALDEWNLKF